MEEDERKWKYYDITQLNACIKALNEAKSSLVDVDDTFNFYKKIHDLREEINDFKLEREAEL